MGLFDIFKKKPVDGTYRRDESGAGFAQDGVYSDPERFCIVVEDVFSITGRGTVITGQVRSGRVAVGDRVTLKRLDGSVREVNIGSIEMFRRMHKAEKGDNVGILLRGLEKSDVGRGDILER